MKKLATIVKETNSHVINNLIFHLSSLIIAHLFISIHYVCIAMKHKAMSRRCTRHIYKTTSNALVKAQEAENLLTFKSLKHQPQSLKINALLIDAVK